jgi:hypothetical protein
VLRGRGHRVTSLGQVDVIKGRCRLANASKAPQLKKTPCGRETAAARPKERRRVLDIGRSAPPGLEGPAAPCSTLVYGRRF